MWLRRIGGPAQSERGQLAAERIWTRLQGFLWFFYSQRKSHERWCKSAKVIFLRGVIKKKKKKGKERAKRKKLLQEKPGG